MKQLRVQVDYIALEICQYFSNVFVRTFDKSVAFPTRYSIQNH